jgi:hypothetical protein
MKREITLGDKQFEVTDIWPTTVSTPVQHIEHGVSAGKTFVSLRLTKKQREFLGNTVSTHLRIEVAEVK